MINKPFRITIESWDNKVSVETDHSDVDINQVAKLLASALLAAGFVKESIDEILDYED